MIDGNYRLIVNMSISLILSCDGRGNNMIFCNSGDSQYVSFRVSEIDGKLYGKMKKRLVCKNLPYLVNSILHRKSHIYLLRLYNMDEI